ncbi:hypothetical protein CQW23_04182 [Capsicum baccatum]|uniref:Bifunctional inhibitor/plant lipid transfer protein/seed storage helical domain-containing protein n=1 Tax=Capsicum baccatum TaxID=33114 RepID=A0A2G2XDX6_CAPBA|nr:hypothetical protein CQW23_04182 [Capsicum baccatum]
MFNGSASSDSYEISLIGLDNWPIIFEANDDDLGDKLVPKWLASLSAMPLSFPLESFLLGRATSPSQDCCVGLQGLAKTAITSQSERKDICMCIRTATQTFAFDYTKAVKLPQLCNYTSAISIELNLDCSK